jgi:hypothetical protein
MLHLYHCHWLCIINLPCIRLDVIVRELRVVILRKLHIKMSNYGSLDEIRDKIRRNILQTEPKEAARDQILSKFEALAELNKPSYWFYFLVVPPR